MQIIFSFKVLSSKPRKVSRFALYMTSLYLLLLGTSCGKNDDQSLEIAAPLNCIYPGDLELDPRTKDVLSKYKGRSIQDNSVEGK